jgi:bifunctional DNA-binding transcriptional regulator/antitoxin component of YhaV-PrlF toxin-antitoxin module
MNTRSKSNKQPSKSAIKLGADRELVIPKRIYDKLGFSPGDFVEITQQGKTLVLTPQRTSSMKKPFDRDLQEALEDVRAGRMSGPFKTVGELKRHLESLKI